MKKKDKEVKICWACKRALFEENKIGLCPDCVNKYGTPAAAVGAAGVSLLARQAIKHGGKVIKIVANVLRHIK